MKIFLIIGSLLVVSAWGQSQPTTSNKTKPPKPTKTPKSNGTKEAITCDNIINYPPQKCCSSFPKYESKETSRCLVNCMKPDQTISTCCMTNCTLNLINSTNADQSFDADKIAKFFTQTSNSKNKTSFYVSIKGITERCIATVKVSQSTCISDDLVFCILREAFFKCPNRKNSTQCDAVYDAAKNCTGYPLVSRREYPKAGEKGKKQPSDKKDSSDGKKDKNKNDLKNSENNSTAKPKKEKNPKNPESTVNGEKNSKNNTKTDKKDKPTKTPVEGLKNSTSKNDNITKPKGINITKNPRGNEAHSNNSTTKRKAKLVQGIRETSTTSGKSTTHISQSANGALGEKGPMFRE